MATGINKWWI